MTKLIERLRPFRFRLIALLVISLTIIGLLTADRPAQPVRPGSGRQTVERTDFAFPAGGRQVVPAHRLVGLYGAPDTPALGALGEQPVGPALERTKSVADQYRPLSAEPVLPTIELITTVAAAEPTANADYSRETDIALLRPWVEAAAAAGVYVILDLQPGSTDFLTQAKQYEPLLRYPHVGLALDPEWRLQPGKQHLVDIGSVGIDEVNATGDWLAGLTRQAGLPQKVFLLHQFRTSMIEERSRLRAGWSELGVIIQMDGQGDQTTKLATYRAITADAPAGVRFGWKNFYAKDTPVLTPAETLGRQPAPWFVSYQ